MTESPSLFRNLGHGLGLRREHYRHVIETRPRADFFEIISENFMVAGGNPRRVLNGVRAMYPVVMHGVSLSIGSVDPLDFEYLRRLRDLVSEVEPAWVSDHLSWGRLGGINSHDLLPLPYTEESLGHVVARVERVQEFLGRRILLENPSSYLGFVESTIPEWEFLAAVAQQADCGILLDVNNVYVSSRNHGFDARRYIEAMPATRVGQLHLAGHRRLDGLLFDTHDVPVPPAVWELYRHAVASLGARTTLIEWDDSVPSFRRLAREAARAREIAHEALTPGHREAQDHAA